MKRCPNGTRKDKKGNCVPKNTAINSFNSCDEDREWYINKCYKTCNSIQHRNPETRRCRKTCGPDEIRNIKTRRCTKVKSNLLEKKNLVKSSVPVTVKPPAKVDNKYELILKRFVNKIKKDIKDQPSVPGKIRKHKKLEISYLKSMCGDVGICLSLNNNYDKIMNMFNHFTDFQYLLGSPKEIASGVNGVIRILKFKKTVENISFNSYVTLKVPRSINSDNLAYEYFVGHLCINHFCKYFPTFVETYGLYHLTKEARLRFINPVTQVLPVTKTQLTNGMSIIDPLNNPADLIKVCSSSDLLCLSGQFYNNFITFKKYGETNTNNNYSDFPFILFQVYYTLHHVKTFFTHYDLHYENVGLVALPDGYHIDYEYELIYNGQPAVIRFKSKYIVKIIDYGRSYFQSQEPPYTKSKELIKDITKRNNLCSNKLELTHTNINNRVKNESSDLRFLRIVYGIATFKKVFKNYPTLETALSNILFKGNYSTREKLTISVDGIIRNVTDAHNYLSYYLLNNTDNSNGLNDAAYVGSNSLGTLTVSNLSKPMKFVPSIRKKQKGDKSRFEIPEIVNASI
jgi:hypothetical protein